MRSGRFGLIPRAAPPSRSERGSQTHEHENSHTRPGFRRDQEPPAGRLGLRRLRRRRHHAADRRRDAVRGRRPAQQPARARRRRRQRQCDARRRAPLRRGHLDRLCRRAARARPRARRGRAPAVTFQEADAEALPFEDASFDVVLSTFGVMFTPNQEQAARELLRVCRPGGKIGLANWTPESFIGRLFKTIGKYVPPAPGVKSPALWGTEAHLDGAVRCGRALSRRRAGTSSSATVARALAGGLPHLLRPGAEGLRGDRTAGARGARGRSPRSARRIQRRRGRHGGRPREYLEVVITKKG